MTTSRTHRLSRCLLAVATLTGGLLVGSSAPAQAAPGVWTPTTLKPLPYGPDSDSLSAISCPAVGSCVALGYSDALGPVVETLAGGGWTTAVLAGPDDTGVGLRDISCSSTRSCDAVGATGPANTPVLARLRSGSWSYSRPKVAGGFAAISCAAADTCTATGDGTADDSTGRPTVIAYAINGTTVTPTQLSIPADLTHIGRAGPAGISCATTTSCTIVGTAVSDDADEYSGDFPFAETLSGGTWTASDLPSGDGDFASDVSCPSVATCYAIGQEQGRYGPVNGSSYVIKIAEGKTTTTKLGSAAQLDSVSCADATHCVAFGINDASEVDESNLPASAVLSGGTWTVEARAYPPGSLGTLAYPYGGVDCAGPSFCVAAGYLTGKDNRPRFLAETFRNGAWSASEADTIAGAPTGGATALSCESIASCVVVGSEVDTTNRVRPLAEVRAGGLWTRSTLPSPAGSAGATLNAVSCVAADTCIAVGQYVDVNGRQAVFVERYSHGTWRAHSLELSFASGNQTLTGVECFSATSCFAVGYYADAVPGENLPFAAVLSGASWTRTRLPGTGVVNGLDCQSVRSCVAVGGVGGYDPNTTKDPEAWTLSGSKWTLRYLPSSATTGPLSSVSCVSATVCTAVGGGGYVAFVETLHATAWSLLALPPVTPQSISCVAETSCTVVGQALDNQPAIETRTASDWTEETLDPPKRGSKGSGLAGVQCFSATTCIAAGTALSARYPDQGLPFIERRS